MATLAENAAAVKAAQVAIDAAIVAKGGTTEGGLNNAAAAIASIPSGGGEPEYPHPWKNDGNTHIWWYFGPNTYLRAYFTAQYISDGHTFVVDWGDGQTETIAASTAFTTRELKHDYAEGGEYEVVIYAADGARPEGGEDYGGYDQLKANNNLFGSIGDRAAESSFCVRQAEIVCDDYAVNNSLGASRYLRFERGHFNSLGYSAFRDSVGVVEFEGLEDVVSLDQYSFESCLSMVSFPVSTEVVSIPGPSFRYCYSLLSVPDLSACTSIGNSAFSGCSSLASVGDLSACTSIGNSAFSGCSSLASLTFRTKTHTEVEAITGFTYFPNRGTACVFHCSDGDYYRSGTSLLPVPTEG